MRGCVLRFKESFDLAKGGLGLGEKRIKFEIGLLMIHHNGDIMSLALLLLK